MRSLLAIIGKDLRLLWRDRAGVVFLTIAPIVVISVAGVSLANLYGADPTGQTAYELPLVDQDGGRLGREIREHLAKETAVRLRVVSTPAQAERLVQQKIAGTAIVIPAGTEAALARGEKAQIVLYTDAVKYLERLNVRMRLIELRDAIGNDRRDELAREATAERGRLHAEVDRLDAEMAAAREKFEATWQSAAQAREQAIKRAQAAVGDARRLAEAEAARRAAEATQRLQAQIATVRSYLDEVTARRADFEAWLRELQRLAGSHARDIPPPPSFPEVPPAVAKLLDTNVASLGLASAGDVPDVRLPELPPLPPRPDIELPQLSFPEPPTPPGSLDIHEVNVGGGSLTINTFDQNVPGFSVTFLLLGVLFGVSLALLDEREWGTLDRLRTLPISAGHVLLGKLSSQCLVGVLQMTLLFAVGYVAFGVSLGPQPWALLVPTVGMVFAATGFGLIVAAVAPTREAVLPLGAIVMVTMCAVGGCWWPIDLEPRWMRSVARVFPTTWAMDAFNDLMIRHRGPAAALRPALVMFVYGSLYLATGLALFQRQLRRKA